MTEKKPGMTEAKAEPEGQEIKGVEELDDADLDDAAGGLSLLRDATLSKSSIDSGEFDTVFAGAADFNTVGYDFNTAGFNIDGIDKLKR